MVFHPWYAAMPVSKKRYMLSSAYATALGICYGWVTIDEKESEIIAIPDLLDYLSVKGYLLWNLVKQN